MLCRFRKSASAGRERPRCVLLRSLLRPLAMRGTGRRRRAPPNVTAGTLTARQIVRPARKINLGSQHDLDASGAMIT